MEVVAEVAAPVFALIFAGWLAGRLKVLGQDSSLALNRFVYFFALPAVLFHSLARRPLAETLNGPFIGAFLGGMLVVYALSWLLGMVLRREHQAIHSMQALTACFSNTGYMGIPLFLAAYGADRLLPALVATVIMSAVMVGLAVIAIELVSSARASPLHTLADVGRALARNPLVLSSLAGIAWSALGLGVPKPLATFCDLLGAAAGPCALFAIGLFLAGRPLLAVDWSEVPWVVTMKLLVHPAITWILIQTLFPMDPFWTASAMVLAALPTGALTFVVATQYNVYVERTSQAILVSTLMSLPTLSAVLYWFRP